MGLEMKPGAKHWYGRFRDGKDIQQIRLNTEIQGRRPARLSERGDRAFETSRADALAEFRDEVRKLRGDPIAERMVQRLAEIKTGKQIEFPKLAELPKLWMGIPRRRTPGARYVAQCEGGLKSFVEFVQKEQPTAKEFVTVTPDTARAFMDSLAARGLAPKTWNDTLKLLRTTFKRLHPQLTDGSNPFQGQITKSTETVNRDPYTVDEMKFILKASEKDPFIRPIIVAGMCTAMRRGDCCLLEWEDVDLKEGFLTVKTAKTGETVDIPLFPMLRDLLAEAYAKAKAALVQPKRGPQLEPEGFVFPEQAAMYQKTADGITWRVKKVITEAFKLKAVAAGEIYPEGEPDEVRRRANEYIDSLGNTPRAPRMRKTFELYMSGMNADQVAAETGQTKPAVSHHLNEIEDGIRLAFIRGKVRLEKKDAVQKNRAEGKGARRASVRDFHSFRVTWITLALAAGVPLELVQRVTGHKTVEVVLKHYFRPGREDFKQRIMAAMPELLTAPTGPKALTAGAGPSRGSGQAGPEDSLEEALKALEGMNPRNWRKQRDAVAEFIRQAKDWVDTRVVREEVLVKEVTDEPVRVSDARGKDSQDR